MDVLGLAPAKVWLSRRTKVGQCAPFCRESTEITGHGCQRGAGLRSSDSEQFSVRKIPRITIHSLSQQTYDAHILHTWKDRISFIRMDDYYQTYRLLAAREQAWAVLVCARAKRSLIRGGK